MTATSSGHSAATTDHDPPNAVGTAPITVEQAAAALGVSVTTVKRRIRSGALRGEQAQRPQGAVWLVYLDPAATPPTEERPPTATVAATAPTTPNGQAEALATLVQATLTPIIGPLVAELTAQRQTVERQADQLVTQAETIGQLRAENAALLARSAPVPVESLPAWWRGSWPWIAATGTLSVVVVLLVGMLR